MAAAAAVVVAAVAAAAVGDEPERPGARACGGQGSHGRDTSAAGGELERRLARGWSLGRAARGDRRLGADAEREGSGRRAARGGRGRAAHLRDAEEAGAALIEALGADDVPALVALLGSAAEPLLNAGDPAEERAEREDLHRAGAQLLSVRHDNETTAVLIFGDKAWPFRSRS